MSKGAYIGVDEKARNIKGMYIGVNGVARKVKKAYIGVNGVAREWYLAGKELSKYQPSQIVMIPELRFVNGVKNYVNVEYIVIHQGLPSSIYDESCNGTWLLRREILANQHFNSSDNNMYENCELQDIFDVLDEGVKSAIKTVKIPYCTHNGILSGANGLVTKTFILSAREIGFTTNSPNDGAKLDFFDGTDNGRIALYDGTVKGYWTRSAPTDGSNKVICTDIVGAYTLNSPTAIAGYRPAFILNSDTLFDPKTNTIL